MMSTRKPLPAVLVTWRDSASSNGWRTVDELGGVMEIKTLGWLVRRTKTEVTISSHHAQPSNAAPHCDAMSIPREAISSIRTIRLIAPRKPRRKKGK